MKFVDAIEIAAPAAVLFELTQNYSRRLEWDPFLRSAELLDGPTAAGVGVRAWCVAIPFSRREKVAEGRMRGARRES